MALLVVRLFGWALHLETGRDEPDPEPDDGPTVASGDLLHADEPTEPRLGFAPPGVEPATWE
jgi:hypothetical protein